MRANRIVSFLLLAAIVLSGQCQTFQSHSVLQSGIWYRIPITETGVYKITTATLPAIQSRPFDSIALFGNDGNLLSEDNSAPYNDDLPPCSFDVHDANNNGRFDSDDYILFYAEGHIVWRYDEALRYFVHTNHPYADCNYIYLCLNRAGGRRVATRNAPSANQPEIATHTAVGLYEKEQVNANNSGRIWLSDKSTPSSNTHNVTVSLPTAPNTGNATVRVALASVTDNASYFNIASGGTSHRLDISPYFPHKVLLETYPIGASASVGFDISFFCSDNNASGYIDYIEVNAPAPNRHTDGSQLLFRSTANLGPGNVSAFAIQGTPTCCWDVTRTDSVCAMVLTTTATQTRFTSPTDRIREYVAFRPADALTPSTPTPVDNQDIHGAQQPDLVIVTHPAFLSQAQRLASLHSIYDNLEVLTVTQDQVFHEFSSGKKDPMAIRAMMRMFAQRGQNGGRKPRYLLLFGKGTYDNRNLQGRDIPTVVTYQSYDITTESEASCSDDIFGFLDNTENGIPMKGLDLGIGRLPAKSATEADHLVNKIEGYLTRRDLQQDNVRGDWRNSVALLADDADPSCPGDKDFAESSEYLANRILEEHPHLNIDKIYADAYTQQSGTIGSYYPDVNNTLKQRLDYGCLLLNYIGHGSDLYIGTERYMELSDISYYANTDRLPFFVTSTCSFGKYDRMDGVCGSEAFVLAPGAGVATVSAARPIAHMRSFNTTLCMSALTDTNTIGDAVRLAKNAFPMAQNRSITLMGDPALRLTFPKHRVVVTAINGTPVQAGRTDSAQVLSRVTVEGEIRSTDGTLQSDFTGLVFPVVYDRKTQCRTLANDNEGTEVDFTQQKSILYKGRDSVVNGRFTYSFIVPRDVAYLYDYGKLSHYAKSVDGEDATGAYTDIMFGGFDENADLSETRPDIRLFMGDTNFVNGGTTDESPTLYAELSDKVGINAVGSGLGHDITAVLDGNDNNVVVLNDYYETDIHDYLRGHIRYPLTNLAPGRHTLTLKAWNIYNYSNSATVSFVVRSADTVAIGQFRCHPNPASGRAILLVEHNSPSAVTSAQIDIYDMRGQRVRTLRPAVSPDAYTAGPVEWDLRTDAGSPVSSNVYLARATLTTADGTTLSATTKIIVAKNN